MLQIRLIKGPSSEGGSGAKPSLAENVTVACPDHLVLADLPVAKGIGGATAASLVKSVGRRSRRQLGERVHFCVRCDFPIAIYGRLSPCEHAFCLDCARSDSTCYLCDERIQKIQTIKIMEGIFICAAPHCLKSFLKRSEFESHIHESHADLLQPNAEKEDGNESEAQSITQPTVSDSTARAPPRPVLSPGANSQLYDREDKTRRLQNREQLGPRPIMQQPMPPQMYGILPSDPHNRFQQQSFDAQGTPQQESGQFSDKQPDNPFPEYPPMHSIQQPNFAMPVPPFGFPPFQTEGAQPFYGGPYEMTRQDSAPEMGSEQGSVLGFPPGPATAVNYPSPYPQPWNTGPAGIPFEAPPGGMGTPDRFANPDSHGKVGFYQGGDYGRNSGAMPLNPLPPMGNKAMDGVEPPRDGKGVLAPQPMQLPPPPPTQAQRGQFYSGDMGSDAPQGYGWQHENHGSFGNSLD